MIGDFGRSFLRFAIDWIPEAKANNTALGGFTKSLRLLVYTMLHVVSPCDNKPFGLSEIGWVTTGTPIGGITMFRIAHQQIPKE